ncbi:MAG: hypothetical protein HY941_00775 [Gammaproteobacteria bacterium]|nr:hypothetical protein [Gammaproteobacteria bacterium]
MISRRVRLWFVCLCGLFVFGSAPAGAITLDFSSGVYNSTCCGSNQYREDDFLVSAWPNFSKVFGNYGPRLAWYDGWGTIRVEYTLGAFDLNSVYVPVSPYAGLVFTSSTGAQISFGSGTGTLVFSGPQWTNIDYFTIRNMTGTNILTQLDNFVLTPQVQTVATPVPPALALLASGMIALVGASSRARRS